MRGRSITQYVLVFYLFFFYVEKIFFLIMLTCKIVEKTKASVLYIYIDRIFFLIMLTCKIVEKAKASVLYIYID